MHFGLIIATMDRNEYISVLLFSDSFEFPSNQEAYMRLKSDLTSPIQPETENETEEEVDVESLNDVIVISDDERSDLWYNYNYNYNWKYQYICCYFYLHI